MKRSGIRIAGVTLVSLLVIALSLPWIAPRFTVEHHPSFRAAFDAAVNSDRITNVVMLARRIADADFSETVVANVMLDALHSRDERRRRFAMACWSEMVPHDKGSILPLTEAYRLLTDVNERTIATALSIIAILEPNIEKSTQTLAEFRSHSSEEVRMAAGTYRHWLKEREPAISQEN